MVLVQHRLPENAMRACFDARCLSSDNRRIGYCQSMNYIAAHLLCNLKEEDAFWMLVQISQKLVPEYYGPSMGGLQAHAALLERLARRCDGRVASLLAAVWAEIYLCNVLFLLRNVETQRSQRPGTCRRCWRASRTRACPWACWPRTGACPSSA
eukprot:COSAG01_NODE_7665_length_3107_cov_2.577793_4_plen_154_part_00